MQHDPNHPRPWSEIRQILNAAERDDFIQFAARYGVDVETADDWEVEAQHQRWKLSPEQTSLAERVAEKLLGWA